MAEPCDLETFNELKNLFARFASLCSEELLNEDHLILCYESCNGITMHLSMLGSPLEVSFSMAMDEDHTPLGKLKFNQVGKFEKRFGVWTLYFDREGKLTWSSVE